MQIAALGLAGMQQAETRVNRISRELPKAGDLSSSPDQMNLSSAMLSLLAAQGSFTTNAKLITSENEMSQTAVNLLG